MLLKCDGAVGNACWCAVVSGEPNMEKIKLSVPKTFLAYLLLLKYLVRFCFSNFVIQAGMKVLSCLFAHYQ